MVNFSEVSPFGVLEGNDRSEALVKQHLRRLQLLRSILQVDVVLAGAMTLALLGRDHDRLEKSEQKVQAILQAVTCCVFLSASAHTVLLMVCTGKKYTLAWYDPLFSVGFTVTGLVLLYVTIADAVLIALRLENVHKAGYWCFVIFGMLMPMFLAGPLTVLQMLLHTFASKDDLIEVEENIRRAGSGDG
ncbi:unnamed protein product [Ascophyllum nodosum]